MTTTTADAERSTLPPTPNADIGPEVLREAVTSVLPTTLVSSAAEAEQVVRSNPGLQALKGLVANLVPVLAAALGGIAARPLAAALTDWLAKQNEYLVRALPRWFQPDMKLDCKPAIATLTEFSNRRSKYVRNAVDDRVPVLLTRYGRVVAAVVPLREGAFEQEVYPDVAHEIRAEQLHGISPTAAVLSNLTDEEIELIRTAEDPIQAAASIGIDLTDGSLPPTPQSTLPDVRGEHTGE